MRSTVAVATFLLLACSSASGGGPPGTGGTAGNTASNAGSGGLSAGGSATDTGGNGDATGGQTDTGGTTGNAGTTGGTQPDGGTSIVDGDADGGAPQPTIVGTLGDPCSPNGAYGCAGNAQKGQLICMDGMWAANGNCSGDLNCDSTPGVNAGSCQPILPECEGKEPGAAFCRSTSANFQCGTQLAQCARSDRVRCGPDLVTTLTPEQCPYLCTDGECTGTVCPPGYSCPCGDGPLTCDDQSQNTYAECVANNRTCACDCECAAPKKVCNGVCTDTNTDNDNCGTCGNQCTVASGRVCQYGTCVCNFPTWIYCPSKGYCQGDTAPCP